MGEYIELLIEVMHNGEARVIAIFETMLDTAVTSLGWMMVLLALIIVICTLSIHGHLMALRKDRS